MRFNHYYAGEYSCFFGNHVHSYSGSLLMEDGDDPGRQSVRNPFTPATPADDQIMRTGHPDAFHWEKYWFIGFCNEGWIVAGNVT